MKKKTAINWTKLSLLLTLFIAVFTVLTTFIPIQANAATCQGATTPCAEDPAIQSCNVCHSIQIQGGNRNSTDRFITWTNGPFRHILDPKQADWTATVNSMVAKGAAPADPSITSGYLNMNYCSTCTGVIVSSPTVVNIKDTTATITWSTSLNGWQDGPADSVVFYGTSPTALTSQASDPTLTGTHSVALTGLKASTKYYYQYQSTGTDGKPVKYNFTTPFFRTTAGTCTSNCGGSTANFAYVAEQNSNSISVVNIDKYTLDTTIFLPGSPFGIVASPDGKTVYVSTLGPVLNVIDTATNTIKQTLSGFAPGSGTQLRLAISPNGQYLFGAQWPNTLVTLSTANLTVVKSTVIPQCASGGGCSDLAVSGDGTKIFMVAGSYFSTAVMIDEASAINPGVSTIITPISIPNNNGAGAVAAGPDGRAWIPGVYSTAGVVMVQPSGSASLVAGMSAVGAVTITNLGDTVYVPKVGNNSDYLVQALDTTSLKVTVSAAGTISGFVPTGMAVNSDGSKLLTTAYCNAGGVCSDILYIIDTTSLTVLASVQVGSFPIRVAVATVTTAAPPPPPPTLIYSANGGVNSVAVIDPATNTVTATVPVGTNPLAEAATPDGKLVYVVNGDGTVSVITRSSQTVTATITLPDPVTGPVAAISGPSGSNLVYVANHNAMKIYVINTQTNTITGTIPVGAPAIYTPQGPLDLAISPDGTTLYVNVDVVGSDPTNADGYVAVIQTSSGTVVGKITLPVNGFLNYHTGGTHIAMNPLGGFAYVTADPYGVVLDTVGNRVVTPLKIPTSSPHCYVMAVAVTPDGGSLGISCWNVLYLYDTSSLVSKLNTGQNVSGVISSIAITGDSSKAYLSGSNSTLVTNVDLTTLAIIGTIPMPVAPNVVEASPSVISVPGAIPIVLTAPDLTFSSISAASPVDLSNSPNITITGTIQNLGATNAGSFVVNYYLSPTNTFNPGTATLIGSQTYASLNAGVNSAINLPLTIPGSFPVGNYYLLAYADAKQQIAESNKDNNIVSSTGTLQLVVVDLVETTVTSPAIGTSQLPGATFSVTDTVINQGSAAVGGFTVGIYLYPVGAGSPIFVGARGVSGLAVGGSSTGTITAKIPTTVPGGGFYLQAVADYSNQILEGNKTNNTFTNTTGTITLPLPDLTITAVSSTAISVTRGGTVSITFTVKNQGQGGATSFNVGLYLSKDNVITTSDKILGSVNYRSGLSSGVSNTQTPTVTIPTTVSPGTYYLGAYADYLNSVPESNETNNSLATISTLQVN
jgi:YVTN family beta-propeller protein